MRSNEDKKSAGQAAKPHRRLKKMTMEISTAESAKEQVLSDEDLLVLRPAQEKINRRRDEQATKKEPRTTLTRELGFRGFRDSEDFEVQEVHEVNKESPSGDIPPSAEPLGAVSNAETQNTKDRDSGNALLTASVESKLSTRGAGQTEAELLFSAGRYGEIGAGEFIQLAWSAAEGNSWQETGCSETWEFCRYLLAHSEFKSLRGAALARKLRRLTDLDEDLLDIILSEIELVKYAKGTGPFEWAVALSLQYPLSDPDDLGIERYNKFLSIAGWLQRQRPDKSIVLPVAKIASELGVTAQMVSLWRRRAQKQGLLKEVECYNVERKKATRFRFAMERFSILREGGGL
jgi:hypothetical protein